MPFFRSSTAFTSLTRRAPLGIRQPVTLRTLSSTHAQFAQGYGDGEGDPNGETPQHQPGSNSTKHNAEHPGPEPPTAGKGTGAGPTKAGTQSPEESSAQSGGSRSKEAKETGSSPTGGAVPNAGGKSEKSKNGASPKIHDKDVPGPESEDRKAEVEQHNKEFEQGHDRAPKSPVEDQVDKKFWKGELQSGSAYGLESNLESGHGGADSQS